jgi:hypothetical protein
MLGHYDGLEFICYFRAAGVLIIVVLITHKYF